VAVEGGGGVKSAGRAKQFLEVGYDVVLFIDSDDEAANAMVPEVVALGGTVIQWGGDHSTETAVCAQLDEAGLNGFILAGIEAADDEASARQSFAVHLVANGAPSAATGADPLDVSTWLAAGVNLVQAREVVGNTAKKKSWFKRVDTGRRLGRFILETPGLRTGDVGTAIDQLNAAIYTGTEAVATEQVVGPAEPANGLSNA
jgi:hypothetical protein